MYLKIEEGEVTDTTPAMSNQKRIKIGTLKVNPHGTKLGERLVKKAIDFAIKNQVGQLYLTTFPKHKSLIGLIEEFGFSLYGTKTTGNGIENVYLKYLDQHHLFGALRKDYPLIDIRKKNCYLLAIKPEWHTKLFPDSMLTNESYDSVQDVSYTNSISKSYICFMSDVAKLAPGDIIVIYRMKDDQGPAEYRSVVTSICSVESVRSKSSFADFEAFLAYCLPFSVFTKPELFNWWNNNKVVFAIKMLYDVALTKRLIRKTLIEDFQLTEVPIGDSCRFQNNNF